MTPVSADQHNKCLFLTQVAPEYSLSGTEISFLLGTIIISSKLMEDRAEGFMATPENATYHFHYMPLARTQSHGPP